MTRIKELYIDLINARYPVKIECEIHKKGDVHIVSQSFNNVVDALDFLQHFNADGVKIPKSTIETIPNSGGMKYKQCFDYYIKILNIKQVED